MDRTAVLIVDSADIDHMRREVAAGNMPHLEAFLRESALHPTRNVVSHRSEMAWAQFLGGGPAREIGWYGWWTFRPDEYQTVGTGCAPVTPFYAIDPVESVVADVIQTHARPEVPGSQVFAYSAHSPQFPRSSVPAGLLTDIVDEIGYTRMFNNDHPLGWFDDRYLDALGSGAEESLGLRSEMTAKLLDRTPDWRFLLGCVSEYHNVAHHTWHGVADDHLLSAAPTSANARAAMAATIAATDEHIGAFIELAGDATVVLGSHHGHQAADDVINCVLLPELWYRKDFGGKALHDPDQQAWKRNGMPPLSLHRDRDWGPSLRTHFRPSMSDIPRAIFSRLPRSWYEKARTARGGPPHSPRWEFDVDASPEQQLDGVMEWSREEDLGREVPHWYRRFWPAMRSFAIPTFDDGRIRVNLKGRERDGIVDPSEYEQELADIEAFVSKVVDARTGKPLVREIIFDKLHDPMDLAGPDADVVIRWDHATDAIEHPDIGMIGPHVFMRTSSHREEGWFAVRGADAPAGEASDVMAPRQFTTVVDQLRRGGSYEQAIARAVAAAN